MNDFGICITVRWNRSHIAIDHFCVAGLSSCIDVHEFASAVVMLIT